MGWWPPPGTEVDLTTARAEGYVEVAVRDHGTSVLLIVSTLEFEGRIGLVTFRKGKVDPETLKAVTEFVGGLLAPYTDGKG